MISVSDSSPLITLSKLGRLDSLKLLFPTVVISPEVFREVVIDGATRSGASEVQGAGWIQIHELKSRDYFAQLSERYTLGPGEIGTIATAKDLQVQIVLIDELRARSAALAEGFEVFGCVGILTRLYVQRHISDLRADFQALARLSYVDAKMLDRVLISLELPPL